MDSHVGKFIFENILDTETCILIKNTLILVTKNLSVLPHTDSILVMQEGQIIESGSYVELLEKNGHFANLIQQYSVSENESKEGDSEEDKLTEKNKGAADFNLGSKLVEKEDTNVGRVKFSVYLRYIKAVTMFWCMLVAINYVFSQISSTGSSVWLSSWSRAAEKDTSSTYYYLGIYGAIGVAQGVFNATGWYSLTKGILGAAKDLHNRMLYTIFRSPMSFFGK